MTDAQAYGNVRRLARIDAHAAIGFARQIEDAWSRSQALAHVARFSPSGQRALLDEARTASMLAGDSYKIVAVSAWWIRAQIEVGYHEDAAREMPRLLELSSTIEHPVSRLAALFLLFQAVFHLEPARQLALGRLIEACQSANSWKAGDALQSAVVMLASDYAAEAEQALQAMPEGKYKRKACRLVASAVRWHPRPFFW